MKTYTLPIYGGIKLSVLEGKLKLKNFEDFMTYTIEFLSVSSNKIVLSPGKPRKPSFLITWSQELPAGKKISAKILRKMLFRRITSSGVFPKIGTGASDVIRVSQAFGVIPLPRAEFFARIPTIETNILIVGSEEKSEAVYVDPTTGFGYFIVKGSVENVLSDLLAEMKSIFVIRDL